MFLFVTIAFSSWFVTIMHAVEESESEVEAECFKTFSTANKTNDFTYFHQNETQTEKMGYKNRQTIASPISFLSNKRNCTLGLHLKNEGSSKPINIQDDKIKIKDKVEWLERSDDEADTFLTDQDLLSKNIVRAPRKLNIDTETAFCDSAIVQEVLRAKAIFDELDPFDINKARIRANPFETVRSVFFMNRAALKMANIDAATDFIFTGIDKDLRHHREDGPYYFADVCAGPGGFSEYILWRKKWSFKGFGLTLKDDHDFKLYESCCASPVTFQGLYGVANDGNVCNPDNIVDFKERVLHETQGKGVHFMMSDGGFSVEGNENLQEILSKDIYVCQCLVALEIVRVHGHFVTKLFDVFTSFSAGLLFLMSKCFEKIGILKPNASRPANSERYFIASGLKHSKVTLAVREYLRKIVHELWDLRSKNSDADVLEIVPVDLIKKDVQFFEYLWSSSKKIGERQIKALSKLELFCRNPTLVDPRQEDIRLKCLEYWRIPDNSKVNLAQITPDDVIINSIKNPEYLLAQAKHMNNFLELKNLNDPKDWHFCFLQSDHCNNACHIFIGSGNSKAYKLNGNKYSRVKTLKLIRGTIIYGELVKEKTVSSADLENERYSLHVIDALRLGDLSLADLPFTERFKLIRIYCEAINHETRSKNVRVRPKPMHPLQDFSKNLPKVASNELVCDLDTLGFKMKRESYRINSVLIIKSDESQSFKTTYVLRTQVFFRDQWNDRNTPAVSMQELCDFVNSSIVMD